RQRPNVVWTNRQPGLGLLAENGGIGVARDQARVAPLEMIGRQRGDQCIESRTRRLGEAIWGLYRAGVRAISGPAALSAADFLGNLILRGSIGVNLREMGLLSKTP